MGQVYDEPEAAPVVRAEKAPKEAHLAWRFALAMVPVVAGVDKFLGLLVNWDHYLAPLVAALWPGGGQILIMAIGGAEIAAGIWVATRPRVLGYVLTAWVLGMAANFYLVSSRAWPGEWPLGKLFGLGG
jgi:hypothetical protein